MLGSLGCHCLLHALCVALRSVLKSLGRVLPSRSVHPGAMEVGPRTPFRQGHPCKVLQRPG